MARPQKYRKLVLPPKMVGFKPFGIPTCDIESVKLKFEEYESLRLADYEMLSQDQAAERMNISRPTFTRLYDKALKTIAKAFVEGKAIVIEGGNYTFDKDWYRCNKCHKLIEGMENHIKCAGCNTFGNEELLSLSSQALKQED